MGARNVEEVGEQEKVQCALRDISICKHKRIKFIQNDRNITIHVVHNITVEWDANTSVNHSAQIQSQTHTFCAVGP